MPFHPPKNKTQNICWQLGFFCHYGRISLPHPHHIQFLLGVQLSSDQNPVCLFYIGDYTAQLLYIICIPASLLTNQYNRMSQRFWTPGPVVIFSGKKNKTTELWQTLTLSRKKKQNCGTLTLSLPPAYKKLFGANLAQDPSEGQRFLETHGAPHRRIVGRGPPSSDIEKTEKPFFIWIIGRGWNTDECEFFGRELQMGFIHAISGWFSCACSCVRILKSASVLKTASIVVRPETTNLFFFAILYAYIYTYIYVCFQPQQTYIL